MPKTKLLNIIQEIAKGNYSDEIMSLTSPETPEPIRTIAEAMGMMMVKVEAREYQLELMIEELQKLNQQIKENTIATVSTMANALAARDTYTEGHADRVANYSKQIAQIMGLSEDEIEYIYLGGLLHDVGKIGFPDELFSPHNKKNPPEIIRKIVKHPETGADILHHLDFLGPALEYVHCHHERPDGKGYPRKLKGDEIPLGAQIIAVADAFDAITTDRPYQKGASVVEATEILRKGKGTVWHSEAVDAFCKILERQWEEIATLEDKEDSFDLIEENLFIESLELQKGSSVADLTCRTGKYTLALAQSIGEKGNIFSIDLWQNGLYLLERKLSTMPADSCNINTFRSDITRSIPVENKKCDLCLITNYFETLTTNKTIKSLLTECRRILRKKGKLAVIEYCNDDKGSTASVCPEVLKEEITAFGFSFHTTTQLAEGIYLTQFIKDKGKKV